MEEVLRVVNKIFLQLRAYLFLIFLYVRKTLNQNNFTFGFKVHSFLETLMILAYFSFVNDLLSLFRV
jgi:hypothetical protein